MAKRSDMDHGLLLLIVAILAWIVPGAGHFFIKERKRAVIIFVTITLTFAVGLYIGSVGVIDPPGAWPWYVGQMLTTPAVSLLANIKQMDPNGEMVRIVSYGNPHDYGQIYTAIAGALNLLAILSAVYMAHSGRGEMIGSEEDE